MIDESAAKATYIEELLKMSNLARPLLGLVMRKPQSAPKGAYETERGHLLPALVDISIQDLLTHEKMVLRGYLTSIDPTRRFLIPKTAQRYNRYLVKQSCPGLRLSGHLIGSVLSQRSNGANRDNSWVRYRLSDAQGEYLYGEVQCFLKISVPGVLRWDCLRRAQMAISWRVQTMET